MKLRDKKGSISIFVLVALLFMASFLIISLASNVNKSKVLEEQINMINEVYAYSNGADGAYEKTYTDLRNKNKQIMTATTEGTEDTASIELTKTFEDKVSNYRIYGTAEGVGDEGNLFDMNSITMFYDSSGNIVTGDTISNGVITNNIANGGNCNSNITKLEAGKYILSVDVLNSNTSGNSKFVRIGYRDANKTSHTQISGTQFFTGEWVRIYYPFELLEGTEIFGFIFGNQVANTNTLFKNIELRKVTEFSIMPTKYVPYDGYKITVNTMNSRNLFNIDSVSMFYYNDFFNTSDSAFRNIAIGNEDKSISYIENGIITNIRGINSYVTLCSSNVTRLEAGTYTLSLEAMSDKDSGALTGRIGFIYSNGNIACRQDINVGQHKVWKKISYTFTLTSDTDIRGFQFQGQEIDTENFKFKNIQLEKGTEATQYQENNEYEIYISSPLYEGDYIDFKSSKVVRADGTEEYVDLPELQAYEDYTKIEVITENKPSRVEIEYVGYTLEGN